MKPYTYTFCLLFFLLSSSATAQLWPLHSQYRNAISLVNPAAMTDYALTRRFNQYFSFYQRKQFDGTIPGKDRIAHFSMEQLYDDEKAFLNWSWGVNFLDQRLDPLRSSRAYARVVARKNLSDQLSSRGISFGLNAGYHFLRVDPNTLRPFHLYDKVLMGNVHNRSFPSIGWGVYFHSEIKNFNLLKIFSKKKKRKKPRRGGLLEAKEFDLFYFGLSSPQIFKQEITYQNPKGQYLLTQYQHYFATLGYMARTDNYGFLELSCLLKKVANEELHEVINFRHLINNGDKQTGWYGFGLTFQELKPQLFHIEAGLSLDEHGHLRLGLGGDYGLNELGNRFSAIEVNLIFSRSRKKSSQKKN